MSQNIVADKKELNSLQVQSDMFNDLEMDLKGILSEGRMLYFKASFRKKGLVIYSYNEMPVSKTSKPDSKPVSKK